MAIKLAEMALPKTGSGRPGRTADPELYTALLGVLTTNPTIDVDGESRPRVIGDPKRIFDTEGKAVSDGRVYRDALMKEMERTVRVRAIETEKGSGKFGWGVYVPLTEPKTKTEETPAA